MHSLRRHLVDHVSVRKKRTLRLGFLGLFLGELSCWLTPLFLRLNLRPCICPLPIQYIYTSILVTPLPLRQPHQTSNNPIQGRTKIKWSGGLKYARRTTFIFCPPPRSSKGGAHLNCKFIIFGFLDTLKVHIQSNYLTSPTMSLLQTKPPGKKTTNYFFSCSSFFSFRF